MPLIEELTYQLGDTGTILNTSAVVPFVDITRVIGLSSTPYRETERQHEGQDGAFIDAEFEQGKNVILEGTIYADPDEMEEYLDQLKADFAPVKTTLKPFYFLAPGRPERVLFVKPLGVLYDWDSSRRYGAANAQFRMFAEDPRVYTSELEQVIVDVNFPSSVPGFDFDFEFDFGFGAPVAGNTENIVVGGNRPTPPIFTITVPNGPAVNPRIFDFTNDHELQMNIELSSGDSLVINPARRSVLLNGTSNRRGDLVVDDWFFLEVGSNLIAYRTDSTDDSFLTVSYRDAWR